MSNNIEPLICFLRWYVYWSHLHILKLPSNYWTVRIFCLIWMQILYQIHDLQIFFLWFILLFSSWYLLKSESSTFCWSAICQHFFFMNHVLVSILRVLCITQDHTNFILCFLLDILWSDLYTEAFDLSINSCVPCEVRTKFIIYNCTCLCII